MESRQRKPRLKDTEIPSGKNRARNGLYFTLTLEECVSCLITIYPLIIGIRDADFIHLNKSSYSKKNMLLTDYHDIEMTMLGQEAILNSLVFEFTDYRKEDHLDFRDNIIKSIEMVSYLKWLNYKEDLRLKFSTSGFLDLISFNDFTLNFSEYFKRIISKSDNAKIKDIDSIKEKIQQLVESTPDLMQLTNGHDLFSTFAKFFTTKLKGNGMSDKSIATAFRMSFTVEHFKETNLYLNLDKWKIENNTELF